MNRLRERKSRGEFLTARTDYPDTSEVFGCILWEE